MIGDTQLATLLLKTGLTSPQKIMKAKEIQRRHGGPLYLVLLENGLCDERQTVAEVAARLGVPHVSLTAYETLATEHLDASIARRLKVVPVSATHDYLYVAMVDPSDMAPLRELRAKCTLQIQPLMAGPLDVERALERCYGSARVNTRSEMLFGSSIGFSSPAIAAREDVSRSADTDTGDETLDNIPVEILEPSEDNSLSSSVLDSSEMELDSGELATRSRGEAPRHAQWDRGNTMIGAAWTDEDMAKLRKATKAAPFLKAAPARQVTPPAPVPETGEFLSPAAQQKRPETREDLGALERYDTRTLALFLLRRVLNAGLVHPEEVLDEIERYARHAIKSSGS